MTLHLHLMNLLPFLARRRDRIEESKRRARESRDAYNRLCQQRPEVVRISSAISEVRRRNHIAEQVSQAFLRT